MGIGSDSLYELQPPIIYFSIHSISNMTEKRVDFWQVICRWLFLYFYFYFLFCYLILQSIAQDQHTFHSWSTFYYVTDMTLSMVKASASALFSIPSTRDNCCVLIYTLLFIYTLIIHPIPSYQRCHCTFCIIMASQLSVSDVCPSSLS